MVIDDDLLWNINKNSSEKKERRDELEGLLIGVSV